MTSLRVSTIALIFGLALPACDLPPDPSGDDGTSNADAQAPGPIEVTGGDLVHCGGKNQVCCGGGKCSSGLTCGANRCQADPCKSINCGAHGSCSRGACLCRDGFGGARCQNSPDRCAGVKCGSNPDDPADRLVCDRIDGSCRVGPGGACGRASCTTGHTCRVSGSCFSRTTDRLIDCTRDTRDCLDGCDLESGCD
jgi:hypothetical protein